MAVRNTPNVPERDEKSDNPRKLVILLHAFGSGPQALSLVRAVVQTQIPGADVFAPQLPLAKLSLKDPIALIVELLDEIDKRWKALETGGIRRHHNHRTQLRCRVGKETVRLCLRPY